MVTLRAANCRSARSNLPVAQLLDIFAFVSVLLRGMTLAFEALTVGGVIFVLAIAREDIQQRDDAWVVAVRDPVFGPAGSHANAIRGRQFSHPDEFG